MIVDLFAGPGGWDIAARTLGLDPIGLEVDPDACATRAAAGLATLQVDLEPYATGRPPETIRPDVFDLFSGDWPTLELAPGTVSGLIASPPCPAFSQAGNREGVADLDHLCAATTDPGDDLEPPSGVSVDARLLWLPFAWATALRPTWIAFEQVPPVLPFWEAAADALAAEGWSTWAGVVNAADYGVPQTRRRAILLARSDGGPVGRPDPTHHETGAGGLCRWVTMAEALGWSGSLSTGRDWRPDGSSQQVATDRPGPAVTAKSVGPWWLNPGENHYGPQSVDTPARTITGSAWKNWAWERPATTVACDHRGWPPGHRINSHDIARLGPDEAARRYTDRAGTDAMRVTTAELAALQTFPPGYPFAGTKEAQGRQIGNAVPPLLARHLLEQVIR